MFTIQKTVTGNFYHIFNNERSKVNLSDFEVTLDDVDATFSIQCKNGANIPYKPQPINELEVINLNIGTSPIPFSGVDGLRELLTSMNYTPYIDGGSGSGVISIVAGTNITVDDSDPQNPIVSASSGGSQNLAETLAVDNKTNDIPILSNSENGYLYVNDETTILGNDFGGIKKITISEDTFRFDSTVRYDFESKGVNLNTTTDGLGIPRLTTTQMNSIVLPTNGMIVWNTTESATYQYNGATWVLLGGGAVDSVNGQTGVVVLDAADVGADAITTATTGAVISFATPQVYNSIASPSSSNITDNLTDARIGVVQKIYHNAGTAPTVPAGWVLRGTGSYVTSTLNIIYAEWSVGTTVEYWITQ